MTHNPTTHNPTTRTFTRTLTRRLLVTATAALLAVGVAGCGRGGTEPAPDPVVTFDLRDDPAKDIAPIDATRGEVLPAADLHGLLDSLLSEHSALAVHLMRAAADGDAADRAAVTKALGANTESLTGAIGIVYGPDGARAFDQLWKQHIQFFADYAAAESKSARADALDDLHDYKLDFSSFTATATGGRAPLEAVVGLLHTHIAQLTAQSDAYRGRDFDAAVRHQHDARAHMYDISAALAAAISGQQPTVFPGPTGADGTPGAAGPLVAAQVRTEAVQLRLDRAWSEAFRPGLVPSIDAEIARLGTPAGSPAALALGTGPDPSKAVADCVAEIAKGSLDSAMDCAHKALADAAA